MGSARPWSDIDVVVISPDFSEDLFLARISLLSWAAEIDDRLEPQPFTPERFGPNDPLASEIAHRGVRLI
jgi:predicted nucleotidyltransferase